MASVNRVILLGNVGRDPEVKYMPNGSAVCNVSLATTRKWKNKDSGEMMEETEWSRVTAYGRQAEIIGEYVSQGDPLYVEGHLKTRKWQDKDGSDRYTTEIICESLQLLGGRRDRNGGQQEEPQQRQQASAPRTQAPAQRPAQRQAAAPQRQAATAFDNMDDDIPF